MSKTRKAKALSEERMERRYDPKASERATARHATAKLVRIIKEGSPIHRRITCELIDNSYAIVFPRKGKTHGR